MVARFHVEMYAVSKLKYFVIMFASFAATLLLFPFFDKVVLKLTFLNAVTQYRYGLVMINIVLAFVLAQYLLPFILYNLFGKPE